MGRQLWQINIKTGQNKAFKGTPCQTSYFLSSFFLIGNIVQLNPDFTTKTRKFFVHVLPSQLWQNDPKNTHKGGDFGRTRRHSLTIVSSSFLIFI